MFTESARKSVRATDLLSRLGGEEFAAMLYDTTRDKAIAAAAPEFIGREPGIGGDDGGGYQRADLHRLSQYRQAADQQPEHGAGDQIDRLHRAPVEDARARPGDGEGG